MELKTYFAQDAAGNIISSAIVNVFLQGTTTLATGLTRADGTPLENPFAADGAGRIQFRAPDGYYDVRVSAGPGIIQTLTIQCVDYSGAKADADRAEAAADRSDVSADQVQNALNSITGINTNFEQNSREQWRRSLAEAGLTLVDGSFEEGATVNSKEDAVWHIAAGQCYTWDGAFPKAVPAGSTPASTGGIGTGAWLSVGDAALRGDLGDPDGLKFIGRCSDISALRGIEPSADLQVIIVIDHTAGSGFGGGTFKYDAADTTSADNNGTIIVTTGGKRWKRQYEILNASFFGLVPGITTDQAGKIQSALDWCYSNKDEEVVLSKGTFIVASELRINSNTKMVGAGVNKTIIKADPSLTAAYNVITTSNYTKAEHENYVSNIHIANLTVDGNWQNRSETGIWNDGSCIKLVACDKASIKNVKTINAILHGIDISASVYADESTAHAADDNTYIVKGPSRNVLVEECVSMNHKRDDCFTCHFSESITFRKCEASQDWIDHTPTNAQHGFEIDEGSRDVLVDDCHVTGCATAFQCKGHYTTKAAERVTFRKCVSDSCSYGFQIEHYTQSASWKPNGRDVLIDDCVVKNGKTRVYSNTTLYARAVHLTGYKNVTIRKLLVDTLDPAPNGQAPFFVTGTNERTYNQFWTNNIHFDDISIKGVMSYSDTVTDVTSNTALFHFFYSIANGAILSLNRIYVEDAQPRPIVAFSGSSTWKWKVRNLECSGSVTAQAAIRVASEMNDDGTLQDCYQSGYGGLVMTVNAGGLSGATSLVGNNFSMINRAKTIIVTSGTPEGSLYAPSGTICFHRYDGTMYKKGTSSNLNTGWTQVV